MRVQKSTGKSNISKATIFQESVMPADTRLAGYAALVDLLNVQAPVRSPSCISERHVRGSRIIQNEWNVFDVRYWSGSTIADHLIFALKHENLDLLVLKRIFLALKPKDMEGYIKSSPAGIQNRRAWYFYEFLTGTVLKIKDLAKIKSVDLLDRDKYITGKPRLVRRQRINDNLLGTAEFCPIVRRTEVLEDFVHQNLPLTIQQVIARTQKRLIARAATFMLLADSRANFEIEGERPPLNRLERWGRAVVQSGRHRLSMEEINRLHHIIIEDNRFVKPGLRTDGVYLGERDYDGNPLPEFIGARQQDLPGLMNGLLSANKRMRDDEVDPVINAAATAFGFVYIHPFQDGNGRIHRYLIHHVLAESRFTPPGIIFPVSSVMQDRIDNYRNTLQAHSGPLMPYIEWRPTSGRNVEVLNDTADLYRYFDCTEAAEFLYACVARTVEQDLPKEVEYLRRHDKAITGIMNRIEMPDQLAEMLLVFIRQNGGKLAKARRTKEFKGLTDKEVDYVETIIAEAFAGFDEKYNES